MFMQVREATGSAAVSSVEQMRRRQARRGMRLRNSAPLAVAIALASARAAGAHDSWLLAEPIAADGGARWRIAFCTGEAFPRSEAATRPERIASAEWRCGSERGAITGFAVERTDLATRVELTAPGLTALAVALAPRFIELPPEKFDAYLAEEGAEASRAARRAAGETARPGREHYSKFTKTFVQIGPSHGATGTGAAGTGAAGTGAADGDDRSDGAGAAAGEVTDAAPPVVGHTLEIAPLDNPLRWRAGRPARVRVLLDGRPAPGLRMSTALEGAAAHAFVEQVRTDGDGVATLHPDRPGLWLLRTHAIRRIVDSTGAGSPADSTAARAAAVATQPAAEWESFWASITVRIR